MKLVIGSLMEIGEKCVMSTGLFLHAEIKKVLIINFEVNLL